MSMLFSDYISTTFNTYHESGDYAPAYPSFAEKDWALDWRSKYLTEEGVSIKNPMGGSDLFMLPNTQIVLSFQTDGTTEPQTTSAGDYPRALKVTQSFDLPATVTTPTGGAGAVLTIQTSQWYEPFVGLVRAQVDSASLSIYGQDISVPFASTLELLELTPGD